MDKCPRGSGDNDIWPVVKMHSARHDNFSMIRWKQHGAHVVLLLYLVCARLALGRLSLSCNVDDFNSILAIQELA